MESVITTHLKDDKGLIATMIAMHSFKDKTIYVGWSKYKRNKETISFIKKKGRSIAINRATKLINDPDFKTTKKLPFIVMDKLPSFKKRARAYFKDCDTLKIFAQ